MAYIALADIEGEIPPGFLTQALDDDADGTVDAWDAVQSDAAGEVDAILGLRFTTPFTGDLPAIVTKATKVAACYRCYSRRGVANDQNPFKSKYDDYFGPNGFLSKIASGKLPLGPNIARTKPSASIITEKAPTFDTVGRRLS